MASTEDDVVVRLRLKDVRQFIADVKSGKLAIEDLEKQVKKAGQTSARESSSSGGFGKLASHFGFLKYAAIGVVGSLAAAGGGIAKFALSSAASMEQVQVSMETMLGSASKAKSMMVDLQKFAVATPFEFGDVAKQAQHLLAFGFAAKTVIPSLTAVGNAASGLGLGAEGMDRVVTALGQIKMKGRVQGDEMLQLAEAGINANAYLEKAFHLTPQQLQKAQQAGKISAAAAIPVILKGMDDQFHGLMGKQSHTLSGIWSNLHDSLQQGLVKAVNPFVPAMKKWLQKAVDAIPGLMSGVQSGISRAGQFLGDLWTQLDAIRNSQGFRDVVAMLQSGWDVVRDVIAPAVRDFAGGLTAIVASGIVAAAPHIKDFFDWIDQHPTVFKAITVGALAFGVAAWGITAAIGAATAASVAFDAVNPLVWIAAAVVAIGAGLYYAYTHSETFRKFVDGLWDDIKTIWAWIRDHWGTIGPWLTAPFVIAAKAIATIADGIVAAWNNTVGRLGGPQIPTSDGSKPGSSGGVGSWLGGALGLLNPAIFAGGAIGGAIGDRIKTHQADGGTTVTPGMSWVGERGPELLNLPRGAQVIPLPRAAEAVGRGPVHIHVMVDKREIAQAVYDDMGDRVARR